MSAESTVMAASAAIAPTNTCRCSRGGGARRAGVALSLPRMQTRLGWRVGNTLRQAGPLAAADASSPAERTRAAVVTKKHQAQNASAYPGVAHRHDGCNEKGLVPNLTAAEDVRESKGERERQRALLRQLRSEELLCPPAAGLPPFAVCSRLWGTVILQQPQIYSPGSVNTPV